MNALQTLGLLLLGVIALAIGSIARALREQFGPTEERPFKQPPDFRL